jgi:signal recognition particle subunit SRP68
MNALALYARSQELVRSAASVKSAAPTAANAGPPKLDIDSKNLEAVAQHIDGLVSQYRGLVELTNLLNQQKASAKEIHKPPLVERLNEFPVEDIDLKNLVNFPPKLQPIPVKPLFFDLAWNYIHYPGRAPSGVNGAPTAPKTAGEEKKEPTKKGWFGFGR